MRLHYYQFPQGTPEDILLENGCAIHLKDGNWTYQETIPDEYRHLVDHVDDTINCKVSTAKKLLCKYGGCAWTEHIDRDGSVFEITEISLRGNNSKFKYNHHL